MFISYKKNIFGNHFAKHNKMKKLAYLSLLLLGVSFASCKKCATCTSSEIASDGTDSTITSEFCEKGKIYDNAMYQYERAGWVCVED